MDLLLNPEIWVALLTLLALEIVLGIDNVVFIFILVDKHNIIGLHEWSDKGVCSPRCKERRRYHRPKAKM